MYSVVKRDGRIIEFDIGKISEAISKVIKALVPVLEEIDEMVEEAIGKLGRAMYTFAHSLAHWVLHTFYTVTSRIREAICFDPYNSARLALAVRIRVKILTVSFLEHAHVYWTACLHRTQDRGGDDNSDSDIDINLLSLIPA